MRPDPTKNMKKKIDVTFLEGVLVVILAVFILLFKKPLLSLEKKLNSLYEDNPRWR